MKLFAVTNNTLTSKGGDKAETGSFSPGSSSISAMEPDRIQMIKQSVIPVEKDFMNTGHTVIKQAHISN